MQEAAAVVITKRVKLVITIGNCHWLVIFGFQEIMRLNKTLFVENTHVHVCIYSYIPQV